jgi:hypothetical protein
MKNSLPPDIMPRSKLGTTCSKTMNDASSTRFRTCRTTISINSTGNHFGTFGYPISDSQGHSFPDTFHYRNCKNRQRVSEKDLAAEMVIGHASFF